MDSNHNKRLIISRPVAALSSADDRRVIVSGCPPSEGSFVTSWQPLCFSHYSVPSPHFLPSPAAANHHPTFVPENHSMIITPKIEPLETEVIDSISIPSGRGSRGFLRLPMLRSLEPAPTTQNKLPSIALDIPSGNLISLVESSRNRFRPSLASSSTSSPRSDAPRRVSLPSSELSRLRRKKISDRMLVIKSLLPWERRMDTGTMLGEAHKYVRFLEAQVAALYMMPAAAAFSAAPVSSGRGGALGGLERLNRQQMLQVMVNSPRVQEKLYERELCVFSTEQVATFREAVEYHPPSPPPPPPPSPSPPEESNA